MQIDILQTRQEFAALANEWNTLLQSSASDMPFLRHEFQLTWWDSLGGGEWAQGDLLLLTGRRKDGSLAGIAPFFVTPGPEGKPVILLLGSHEIADYLDLIAAPEDLPDFVRSLVAWLGGPLAPAWQSLDLYNLLETSPSLPLLEAAARDCGWQFTSGRLQHCPAIPLPGDWETYLAGIDKKQRHEIRRKMRRAETAEPPARWYIVTDGSALEAEIDAFIDLMAQDPDKAAFLTPPMREHMRKTARCAFDAGCLHLAFMAIGDEKVAGYLSFDYLNRLWVYNSGLDRRYNEYSPGWVLLGYLLQWANEAGRDEFDFMRGDEEYKYRFGAVDRFVMRLTLEP